MSNFKFMIMRRIITKMIMLIMIYINFIKRFYVRLILTVTVKH